MAQQDPDRPEDKTTSPMDAAMAQQIEMLRNLGFGPGLEWFEQLSDIGSEILSFLADRIKEDVKSQHQILHCKDPKELQHLQATFLQTAIDQYTAETGKLVKMSSDMLAMKRPDKGEEG